MSERVGIVLGFDPGGKNNFGWSVCRTDKSGDKLLIQLGKTGLANDALEVVGKVQEAMKSPDFQGLKVLAVGIDAPMFWSGRGNRQVDNIIREELKDKCFPREKVGGTVQHVNSLQGACLAQGLLLARHLNEIYEPKITEAHPKALLYLLKVLKQDREINKLIAGLSDHKRDATISAFAAWAMLNEFPGWRDLYQDECYPVQPFNTPVSYWMPIPKAS